LNEAVTNSFMRQNAARLFGGADAALVLANPISSELDTMRPSILPNLIAAAGRNADRGTTDAALFEVGPQYADDTPQGQSTVAAGVRRGRSGPRHWGQPPRDVDAFDARADAQAVLATLGIAVDNLQIATDAPSWYHPGRSGRLKLGPKTVLAAFGELHPSVLQALDVKGPLAGFEVFLDALPMPKARGGRTRPVLSASDLPAVERDFAFVVDRAVSADQLVRAAKSADRGLIGAVTVFDLYEGAGVGEGKKSLAITVRLEPKTKTLTEAEIEAVAAKIVAAVTKATGGTLRG
jgi:phenylalanyl-tRNA synthetase beta chain